jgi:hypothetical protein
MSLYRDRPGSFLSVIQILTITHLTVEFDKEWKITQYVQDFVLIT